MQMIVLDARVRRLADRVGGERRRHEHHRRVGAGLGHGLVNGVEDRDALDVLAVLAGRDPGDQVGAVLAGCAGRGSEPSRPVRPWTTSLVSCVDEDRHRSRRPLPSFASCTTISAASSIVFAGCSWGASASARMRRPSSSFVPSSRTTIGTFTSIWSSAWRMPVGDLVAAGDAAEDVEQHGLHLRVGEQHLERGHDLLRLRAAAHVEEVRRAPARLRDHVERRHHEPGAVAEDPDLAVELHVGDATLLAPSAPAGPRRTGCASRRPAAGGTARCRRR